MRHGGHRDRVLLRRTSLSRKNHHQKARNPENVGDTLSAATSGWQSAQIMIVLGIHPGRHDASATLFNEYGVLGAVQLERLDRRKGAGVTGESWAWPCVDEVLSMNGLSRRDVDVVALTRSAMPQTYYHMMRTPWRRLELSVKPDLLRKRPNRLLSKVMK
jgi:hypothetical protein